jgi:D-tagatose-1,6-bisphosphate aldolase subunit GatZ/KbaZ
MLENPVYWQSYYPGNDVQQHYARQYSLSDRIRYYWPVRTVEQSLDRLLSNLSSAPIPLPLLSQYLPEQFRAVRNGRLQNQPRQLIQYGITAVLDDYAYACGWL